MPRVEKEVTAQSRPGRTQQVAVRASPSADNPHERYDEKGLQEEHTNSFYYASMQGTRNAFLGCVAAARVAPRLDAQQPSCAPRAPQRPPPNVFAVRAVMFKFSREYVDPTFAHGRRAPGSSSFKKQKSPGRGGRFRPGSSKSTPSLHNVKAFASKFATGQLYAKSVALASDAELDFMRRLDQILFVYLLHWLVIAGSVICYAMETLPELRDQVELWLWLEAGFSFLFTVELILRIVAAAKVGATRGLLKDPLVWIDFLACLPFYLTLFACKFQPLDGCDARQDWGMRVLQSFKILRVFKLSRHFKGTRVLMTAMMRSGKALQLPLFFLLISVALFATLLYLIEESVECAAEFNTDFVGSGGDNVTITEASGSDFEDIVNTAYFVVVTMTTVGYGDQVPLTQEGKFVTGIMMIFGVLVSAMPLAIVGNEFYDAVEEEERTERERREAAIKSVKPRFKVTEENKVSHYHGTSSAYLHLGAELYTLHSAINQAIAHKQKREEKTAKDLATMAIPPVFLGGAGLQQEKLEREKAVARGVAAAEIEAEEAERRAQYTADTKAIQHALQRLISSQVLFSASFNAFVQSRGEATKLKVVTRKAALDMTDQELKALVGRDPEFVRDYVERHRSLQNLRNMKSTDWDKEKGSDDAVPTQEPTAPPPVGSRSVSNIPESDVDSPATRRLKRTASAPSMSTMRDRLFLTLEVPQTSRMGIMLHHIFLGLISLSIVAFAMETMPELQVDPWKDPVNEAFSVIEWTVNIVFTVELLLRFLASNLKYDFVTDFYNILDALAIVPFYVGLIVGDSGVVFYLRPALMLRIFKMSRHFIGTHILVAALRASARPLLIPLYFLAVFAMVFATGLYLAESGFDARFIHQCERSVNEVQDLFRAGWVILSTMTTVGYGDVTPQSTLGKGVAAVSMLFGILYMAMPIAIVGTNFAKAYSTYRAHGVIAVARMAANASVTMQDNLPVLRKLRLKPEERKLWEDFEQAARKVAAKLVAVDMAYKRSVMRGLAARPVRHATEESLATIGARAGAEFDSKMASASALTAHGSMATMLTVASNRSDVPSMSDLGVTEVDGSITSGAAEATAAELPGTVPDTSDSARSPRRVSPERPARAAAIDDSGSAEAKGGDTSGGDGESTSSPARVVQRVPLREELTPAVARGRSNDSIDLFGGGDDIHEDALLEIRDAVDAYRDAYSALSALLGRLYFRLVDVPEPLRTVVGDDTDKSHGGARRYWNEVHGAMGIVGAGGHWASMHGGDKFATQTKGLFFSRR